MNLKNKKIFKSVWFWLALVIVIRIFCVWLAANDIPYTGAREQGMDWWAVHGGDGNGYFQSAKALLSWDFLAKAAPVGFPLLLLPFLIMFGTSAIQSIAVEFMIFQSIIMYAIVTLLVFKLAQRILKNKKKEGAICGLFLVYPYFFYYLFALLVPENEVIRLFFISRFKQLMFLTIHSDALSMILMIGSLILLIRIIEGKTDKREIFLLGFISAWAVIARLQNALILPLYTVLLWLGEKYKQTIIFITGALPLLLWQLYVNLMSNRELFSSAYGLKKGPNKDIDMISVDYFFRLFTYPYRYNPALLIPLFFGMAIMGVGIYRLIKKEKKLGYILASYLFVNSFFIMFLEPVFRNPRYFLPVIPVIIIILYIGIEEIFILIKNLWKRKKLNIA